MKPEKQNLIHDVLGDASRREETLLAGARILRRRRQWRVLSRSAVMAMVFLAATALWLNRQTQDPRPLSVAKIAPKTPSAPQIRALSDEELLALFPNTPVGLASLPNGKKRLIFPRAGDERKFITRL